jgi:hypothetical protein
MSRFWTLLHVLLVILLTGIYIADFKTEISGNLLTLIRFCMASVSIQATIELTYCYIIYVIMMSSRKLHQRIQD